jgi:hypothetical protein
MKNLSFAVRSVLLFGLSVVLLIVYNLADSAIGVMPLIADRIIVVLAFIAPTVIGVLLGIRSIIRREGKTWLALAGILLNGLFAAFHLMIVLLAG